MQKQFPLPLLLAWAAFFACAVGQFHEEQGIRRSGPMPTRMLRAIEISKLLWLVVAIAIAIDYFVVARWYWPFVMMLGGSVLGALVAGLLFGVVGEKLVSSLGFVVWPVSAACAIGIIHGLPL